MLDFHRGTLSARRLWVLFRQLPVDCATNRSLNGGVLPLTRSEHFLADLWALLARQKDHPVRAAITKKARDAKKVMKLKRMQAKYAKRLSSSSIDDSSIGGDSR